MPRSLLAACLFSCVLSACASPGTAVDAQTPPPWARQPSPTVEGGYIVYVGSGEDRDGERARRKAEAQALGDLANECSFAPKGTRIEDRFERLDGTLRQAF